MEIAAHHNQIAANQQAVPMNAAQPTVTAAVHPITLLRSPSEHWL